MNAKFLIKLTIAILALPILIASGCDERYRYPCQNPDNWDKPMCQKPLCEVHRQCPDLIFKEDATNVGLQPKPQPQVCNKGCQDER